MHNNNIELDEKCVWKNSSRIPRVIHVSNAWRVHNIAYTENKEEEEMRREVIDIHQLQLSGFMGPNCISHYSGH